MTGPEPAVDAGRRPRRWLPLGLVLLLLAGVAVAAGLGLQVREGRVLEAAQAEALAQGERAVARLLAYDHRTLEDDVAAGERLATGRFGEQYRSATENLAEQARAGEVVVTADVQAASVQSASADRVVLLLFVDQRTRRAGLEQPRVDQNRVRLTLDRVGGSWLVSELDAL